MTVRIESPGPEEIAARRAAVGLTQEAAGALVQVARRTWQDWERGERTMPPGLWELFRIKTVELLEKQRTSS